MPNIFIRWADNTADLRKNLAAGLDQIEATRASAEKMAQSLGGGKLIQAAHNYVAAVQQVGGAQKLTASEQERVNAILERAIAKYEALGKTAPQAMRDLAAATRQAGEPADGLSSKLLGVGKDALTMATGFITAQAAMAAIRGGAAALTGELETLVMHGSAVSDVSGNFQKLTSDAGLLGKELLGALREGSHNTISDFELMKTVNQDLGAGLRLTAGDYKTLSAGAFALAQATGTDVKTAFDTMNDAMLTGRTRSLALLTGKIDLSTAEEAYAKRLGVTADQLSDEGKLEAAREAILKSVGAATERLGEQTDGLDENVAQISVAWANFHDALAQSIADSPVIAAGFHAIEEAIVGALGSNQEELVHKITDAVNDLALKVPDVIDFIVSLGVEAARVFDDMQRRAGGVGQSLHRIAVGATAGAVMGAAGAGVGAVGGAIIGAGVASIVPVGGGEDKGPSEAMTAIEATAAKAREATTRMREQMQKAAAAAKDFVGPLQETGRAAGAAADQHNRLTQAVKSGGKEAEQAQKFWANLGSSAESLSGAQEEAVRYYREQGKTVGDIAKILGIYEQQVEQVNKADKDRVEAEKATIASGKERLKLEQAKQKATDETLKSLGEGALKNLKAIDEAQAKLDALDTSTGARFKADMAAIDAWEQAEKAKLDTRVDNYKESEAKITAAAEAARAERQRELGIEDVKLQFEVVGPTLEQAGKMGDETGHQFGGAIMSAVSQAFRELPDDFMSEKGKWATLGNVLGAAVGDAIGSQIQAAIQKQMGGTAATIYGIGLEMARRSTNAARGRETTREGQMTEHLFEQSFGGFQKMLETIGRAYVANGKSLEDARRDVRALIAAEADGSAAVEDIIRQIQDGMSTVDEQTRHLDELYAVLATGQLDAAQTTKLIEDNWNDLVTAATDGSGRISARLKEIIALDEKFGSHSKAIAAWKQTQGSNALSGFTASVGQGELLTDKASVDSATSRALTNYSAAVATGTSPAEALQQIGPALQAIQAAYDRLGITIEDTGLKQLMLQAQIQQGAAPSVASIAGVTKEMIALDNLGLETADTFKAQQQAAFRGYVQIQASVAAVGGSTKDALVPMQEYLHQAQEEAERLGVPLDADTQMLIAQSKEWGVWKDKAKSPVEEQTEAMQTLVQAVQDLIDALRGVPPKIHSEIDVTRRTTDVGGDGSSLPNVPIGGGSGMTGDASLPDGVETLNGLDTFPVPHFALGKLPDFQPIGNDRLPAMIDPREMVLTPTDQQVVGTLLAQARSVVAPPPTSAVNTEHKAGAGVPGQVVYDLRGSFVADGPSLRRVISKNMKDAVFLDEDGIRGVIRKVSGS